MDQLKAVGELTGAVAQLASSNNQLVALVAHLTERLAQMESGLKRHDDRARYVQDSAQNMGGPGA